MLKGSGGLNHSSQFQAESVAIGAIEQLLEFIAEAELALVPVRRTSPLRFNVAAAELLRIQRNSGTWLQLRDNSLVRSPTASLCTQTPKMCPNKITVILTT